MGTIINCINGKFDTEKGEYTHEEYRSTPPQEEKPQAPALNIRADALAEKPVHELPYDFIHPELQNLADMMASVMHCLEDIVISTMFAVVSGAVGNNVQLSDGVYKNRVNINVCHVADAGSNKSAPVNLLIKPLEMISNGMMENYRMAKEHYLKDKEKSEREMPRPQVLNITNPTPEGIFRHLVYNQHGLFARRDELAGFIGDLKGRYSNGDGGVDDFLSIFTNQGMTILRATEDPMEIKSPFLTVVGGIQPGIVAQTLGSQQFMNNGFNSRWLFVMPEPESYLHRSKEQINEEMLNWWTVLNYRFHNMAYMEMTFNDDAQKVLDDYFYAVNLKASKRENEYLDGVRRKFLIYVQKLAGIAQLMHGEDWDFFEGGLSKLDNYRFVDNMPCKPVVTGSAVDYAVRCLNAFEKWAEQVQQLLMAGQGKPQMTFGDAIRTINKFHPILNKKQFAESCGMKREQLYKYLPKGKDEEGPDAEVTPATSDKSSGQKDGG